MKSVSSRSMIRCLRTTRSARARPVSVSRASLRAPRSIRPSPSSRFSISPAEARETRSISATRDASGGDPAPRGVYSPIGNLIFVLWDVLSGAVEPIDGALTGRHWGAFAGYSAVGLAGFGLGLMGLVYYAEWMKRQSNRRATPLVGPGAAAIDEFKRRGW